MTKKYFNILIILNLFLVKVEILFFNLLYLHTFTPDYYNGRQRGWSTNIFINYFINQLVAIEHFLRQADHSVATKKPGIRF